MRDRVSARKPVLDRALGGPQSGAVQLAFGMFSWSWRCVPQALGSAERHAPSGRITPAVLCVQRSLRQPTETMNPVAPLSSQPDLLPHVGRNARGRATGAMLFVVLLVLTACTAPSAQNRETTSVPDLSARVTEFLTLSDQYNKVRAVLVFQDGESVLELYHGEDAKGYLNLRSVTKSVMSTLIGIAIDEGFITGVDATLGDLLPAYRDAMSAEVAAIPLDRILTHTAGFAAGGLKNDVGELDFFSAPDWVGAIIADRVARGPGDGSFAYSNAGSHLLAAILVEATGGSVLDFARAKLFDPLGIDSEPAWVEIDQGTPEEQAAFAEGYLSAGFAWPTDPQGIQEGQSLLKLRPEDLAKLGLLFLNDGVWEGDSIVSASWVNTATATHVDTEVTPNGYGYQWWTQTDGDGSMFIAVGYGGNLVAVVPDRGLVAVIASTYTGIDPLENAQQFYPEEAISLVRDVILARPG
jgi:CubicO group peptidase (beta-lactamase class C family)